MREFRQRKMANTVAEIKTDAANHFLAKSLGEINRPSEGTWCHISGYQLQNWPLVTTHTAWPPVSTLSNITLTQPQVALQLHFALQDPINITTRMQQISCWLHCRHASTIQLFPQQLESVLCYVCWFRCKLIQAYTWEAAVHIYHHWRHDNRHIA